MKRKRVWLKVALGVLLALVVVCCLVVAFLGNIVKTGVEQVGSRVTKCDIKVGKVTISPLRGRLYLHDFIVRNPEGFKTDSAFELGEVAVAMRLGSLLSDRIVIDEILVREPMVTYELNVLKLTSNLGQIQKNVEEFLPAKDEKEEKEEKEKEKESEEGRKIQISHLLVEGGKIKLAVTLPGGPALPVPLPKIEMQDIGKDKDITATEAAVAVLLQIIPSVISTASDSVKSLGGKLGDVLKKVGDKSKVLFSGDKDAQDVKAAAKDVEKDVKEAAKDVEKDVKAAAKDVEKDVKEAAKSLKATGKELKQQLKDSLKK